MKWFMLIFLLASPAIAQQADRSWMLVELRACFGSADSTDGMQACQHLTAAKCQSSEDGGYSNHGMTACIDAETENWDVLLNEQYQATMAEFERQDQDGATNSAADTMRAETLRDAQRAWIAYRDAECANVYAMWGSASMRLQIGASCFLSETAERTIELWAKRGFN